MKVNAMPPRIDLKMDKLFVLRAIQIPLLAYSVIFMLALVIWGDMSILSWLPLFAFGLVTILLSREEEQGSDQENRPEGTRRLLAFYAICSWFGIGLGHLFYSNGVDLFATVYGRILLLSICFVGMRVARYRSLPLLFEEEC